MRKLFIALLLISASTVHGQDAILKTDPQTGKVSYLGTVDASGQTKIELFNKAKKWIQTKNSSINSYTISYENAENGSITAKGSFTLPAEERKYILVFILSIDTKDGKFRYTFTDMVIRYTTEGGASHGGYGMWSSTTYRKSETLEYTLETFYPIRLEKRKKPAIKWYEMIRKESFEVIDKEIIALENSLISTMKRTSSGW
ncbi:MAG: DUF4468 domain-containing protein [Chitinophagales bacterium]|nr:DUF4468 domain-containing protein [Chitinophagales bacterium]